MPAEYPTTRPPATPHAASPAVDAFGPGRLTPQRAAIAERAAAMSGAFTIEELGEALKAAGAAAGTATLYRAVAALEARGWLERVGERDGSALYARCAAGSGHHHHLVCDGCGRVEATPCPVASGALGAGAAGFTVTRHEVTLYGLCETCASSANADTDARSARE